MDTPRILELDCEWTSDDVRDEALWTETLSPGECDELDGALRHALGSMKSPRQMPIRALLAASSIALYSGSYFSNNSRASTATG